MRSFYLIRIIDFLLPEVVLEIPLFLVESKQIYQYFSHQSIVYSFSRFAFFKFEDFTLIGSIVEKSRHKLTHSFIILGKFGKIVLLWIGWWSYVRWKLAIRQKSTRHTGKISVLLMYKKVSRPSSRWWVTMQTTVERTPRISLWIYQNLHIALLHFLFDLVLMHQRGGLHRSTVRNDINMASDETRSGVLNMKNLYFSYDENIDISINIFENLLINIKFFKIFLWISISLKFFLLIPISIFPKDLEILTSDIYRTPLDETENWLCLVSLNIFAQCSQTLIWEEFSFLCQYWNSTCASHKMHCVVS